MREHLRVAQLGKQVGLFFLSFLMALPSATASQAKISDQERLRILLAFRYLGQGRPPAQERRATFWNVSQYRHRAEEFIVVTDELSKDQPSNCQRYLRVLGNLHRDLITDLTQATVEMDLETQTLLQSRVGILQKTNQVLNSLWSDRVEGGQSIIGQTAESFCEISTDQRAAVAAQAEDLQSLLDTAVDSLYGSNWLSAATLAEKLEVIQAKVRRQGYYRLGAVFGGQLIVSILVWNRLMPPLQNLKENRRRQNRARKMAKQEGQLPKMKLSTRCGRLLTSPFSVFAGLMAVETLIWNFLNDHLFMLGGETFANTLSVNQWLGFMRDLESLLKTPLVSPNVYLAFYQTKAARDNEIAREFLDQTAAIIEEEVKKYGSVDAAIAFHKRNRPASYLSQAR
jgi:hypothetical protein